MNTVKLSFKRGSYGFMRKTLDEHKNFLYRVGMPDAVRKELIKDVLKVQCVLDGAEANEVHETRNPA